jgi:hypothetical protein
VMGKGLAEEAGAERSRCARSPSGPGNALPVDLERFRLRVSGNLLFDVNETNRVEKRVGDVGECGSAANADAILTGEREKFGNEAADIGDFGGQRPGDRGVRC